MGRFGECSQSLAQLITACTPEEAPKSFKYSKSKLCKHSIAETVLPCLSNEINLMLRFQLPRSTHFGFRAFQSSEVLLLHVMAIHKLVTSSCEYTMDIPEMSHTSEEAKDLVR